MAHKAHCFNQKLILITLWQIFHANSHRTMWPCCSTNKFKKIIFWNLILSYINSLINCNHYDAILLLKVHIPFSNFSIIGQRHFPPGLIQTTSRWWWQLLSFQAHTKWIIYLETYYLILCTEGVFICGSISDRFITVQGTSNRQHTVLGFTSSQSCRCSIQFVHKARSLTDQGWNDSQSFFVCLVFLNSPF